MEDVLNEYYVDWDSSIGAYCIFRTDNHNFAYASFCDDVEAQKYSDSLNIAMNPSYNGLLQ